MKLDIDGPSGMCPVQAEGSVNGFPFYFRARYDSWEFAVAEIGADPVDVTLAPTLRGFYRSEKWGIGPYDAGHMPPDAALGIIRACSRDFVKMQRRYRICRFFRRVHLFLGIVYRPVDTRLWEELPFPERMGLLMKPRVAWSVCTLIHDALTSPKEHHEQNKPRSER